MANTSTKRSRSSSRGAGRTSRTRRTAVRRGEAGNRTSSTRTQERSSVRSESKTRNQDRSRNLRSRSRNLTSMDREELVTRTSDYRSMKRRQRDPFANTVQKSKIWLKEIMEEVGAPDELRAHLALKAVLQTLRDRLSLEETAQLGAQLPELIRGMYYEGWVPAGKPIKYNRAEFVDAVRIYFQNLSGINHEEYIQGVYNVLSRHVSAGELQQVISTLPKDLAELFNEATVEV